MARKPATSGTWKLKDNHTITFFSEFEYVGIIFRDTIDFNFLINANQQLILENEALLLKHRKLQ